jgi:hypothetical protein
MHQSSSSPPDTLSPSRRPRGPICPPTGRQAGLFGKPSELPACVVPAHLLDDDESLLGEISSPTSRSRSRGEARKAPFRDHGSVLVPASSQVVATAGIGVRLSRALSGFLSGGSQIFGDVRMGRTLSSASRTPLREPYLGRKGGSGHRIELDHGDPPLRESRARRDVVLAGDRPQGCRAHAVETPDAGTDA